MIHGRNVILELDGSVVAASKSCKISLSQSFISVASPTAGRWPSAVPEKCSWSCSMDCLMTDQFDELFTAFKEGKEFTVRYHDAEYNFSTSGSCFIDKIDQTGTINSLATLSVSLQGSGELTLDSYEYDFTTGTKTVTLGYSIGFVYGPKKQGQPAPITGWVLNAATQSDSVSAFQLELTKETKVTLTAVADTPIIVCAGDYNTIAGYVSAGSDDDLHDAAQLWCHADDASIILPAGTYTILGNTIEIADGDVTVKIVG